MARAAPDIHAKDMPAVRASKFSKFNVQSLQVFQHLFPSGFEHRHFSSMCLIYLDDVYLYLF